MENGDLRKWHVALALILVGGIVVWAYTQIEPQANPRTMSPIMFEADLSAPPIGKTNPQPLISDVRVYPSVGGVYVVNFNKLVADRKNDQWLKQEWSFTAKSPRHGSTESIIDWLERLKKQNLRVEYTYEWWREPGRLWMIYAGVAGVLALWGMVIPSVMWVAKGGFKEFKKDATASPLPMAERAPAPVATAADHQQLNAMLDRLEENTAGVAATSSPVPTGAPGAADGPLQPATTRVLDGKPLEVAAGAAEHSDDPKDYKGEFYPVARPITKKD